VLGPWQWDQHIASYLAVVIFPLEPWPIYEPQRRSTQREHFPDIWLKKTNLKRRTDERQSTQREKHAAMQRQRAHVHSAHADYAAGEPLAARPAPKRAGRPFRTLLHLPGGVNLDLTYYSAVSELLIYWD